MSRVEDAKIEEFVKEIKKMHKKAKAVLKKLQKEIKKYANRNRKEAVEYKMGNRVLLSIKKLTWQVRNKKIKKLTKKFVKLYKIKKIISENAMELKLPVLIKIDSVVNVSRIAIYQVQNFLEQ